MKNPWGVPLPWIFVEKKSFEKLTNYTSLDAVSHADSEYVIVFVWMYFSAKRKPEKPGKTTVFVKPLTQSRSVYAFFD